MSDTTNDANAAVSKVNVAIVLDRSGSMESCRQDAVGAVNSYLRQLREDPRVDARLSLIIFDSESIDTIRDQVPARTCPDVTPDEYQPRASTPLLDAVGAGAALLDRVAGADERHILAIMTDGLENASREFSYDQIRKLLERKQQEDGWLVVYLGAGHDTWAAAQRIGLHPGSVARYEAAAMRETSDALYASSARYLYARSAKAGQKAAAFTREERSSLLGSKKDDSKPGR